MRIRAISFRHWLSWRLCLVRRFYTHHIGLLKVRDNYDSKGSTNYNGIVDRVYRVDRDTRLLQDFFQTEREVREFEL